MDYCGGSSNEVVEKADYEGCLDRLIQQVGSIQSELTERQTQIYCLTEQNKLLQSENHHQKELNEKLILLATDPQFFKVVAQSTEATLNFIKKLKELDAKNNDLSKLSKVKYELDVVIQQKRGLERDVKILQTENERLSFQLKRR